MPVSPVHYNNQTRIQIFNHNLKLSVELDDTIYHLADYSMNQLMVFTEKNLLQMYFWV